MPDEKYAHRVQRIMYILLASFAAWLALRYALIWLLPFLLAVLTARLMEPAVRYLNGRLGFRRGFAAAVCTAAAAGLATLLVTLMLVRLANEAERLAAALPGYASELSSAAEKLSDRLGSIFEADNAAVSGFIEHAGTDAAERLSGLLVDAAAGFVSAAPRCLLFAVTFLVSLYFTSASYPTVTQFIMRQIPDRLHDSFFDLKNGMLSALGKWLKAQLMLMLMTFGELTAGFLLLRVDYPLMLAALTALIDALPVLGVGTVLLPWSLFSFVTGRGPLGAELVALYGVITLVRSTAEPRLVGAQLGVAPLATLTAVYIGYCLLGVPGMLIAPVTLVLINTLNSRGVIHLWK